MTNLDASFTAQNMAQNVRRSDYAHAKIGLCEVTARVTGLGSGTGFEVEVCWPSIGAVTAERAAAFAADVAAAATIATVLRALLAAP